MLNTKLCLFTSLFFLVSNHNNNCRSKLFHIPCKHFVQFTSSETNEHDRHIKRAAEIETFMEVTCVIPNERRKRDVAVNGVLAKGYKVDVTNDGIQYSEADFFVTYDSECVICNRSGEFIVCRSKVIDLFERDKTSSFIKKTILARLRLNRSHDNGDKTCQI